MAEGESVLSISLVSGEPKHWNAASAQLLAPGQTNDLAQSTAPRTALVFIASHTGQKVKRAAVGAEGWVLDPFSHQAVATHLNAVGEPLLKAFGAEPPHAIFSDSLEAYGADWTPDLPAEFRRRRGYDLLPHLPELVAGGTPEAESVRHDWGKTLTELVDENYLTQINAWAIAHHTKFRSQTYGDPAVSLSSQRLVALPEGEGPHWRAFSTLRWATSANHLFGNNVTSAETFTWLHSPAFRATPLDMKAEVDLHFLIGVNQIIGHGWPYSPPQVGEPGWSLYAAAVFNDHNPWHPVMPDVTRYIQRISFLFRQGQPANQVALLLPTDDAWASFSPGKVSVTAEMDRLVTPALMSAILSAGYNVDYIDADAIDKLGIHYPVLVIPPTDRIPVETLRKIQQYVAAGGKVISVGRAPRSTQMEQSVPEIACRSLASSLPVPNRPLLPMNRLSKMPCTKPFPPTSNSRATTMTSASFAASYPLQTSTSSPIRRTIQSACGRPSRPLTSSASAGMRIPGPLAGSPASPSAIASEPGCLRIGHLRLQRHAFARARSARHLVPRSPISARTGRSPSRRQTNPFLNMIWPIGRVIPPPSSTPEKLCMSGI